MSSKLETAKARNAALTGDYEFFEIEKLDNILPKKKYRIDKPRPKKPECRCPIEELEYRGLAAHGKNLGVYHCKKHGYTNKEIKP